MKKIMAGGLIFLCILCSVICSGRVVKANGAEGDIVTSADAVLDIDDEHVYSGMDRAYEDGYEPVVTEENVSIVLPLCAKEEISFSSVKAVPEVPAGAANPFVIRNYQKTIRLTKEFVKGSTEEQEVFLVKFVFLLKENRVNGEYPVNIAVSYVNNGSRISQTFKIYVRITDGKTELEQEDHDMTRPEQIDNLQQPEPEQADTVWAEQGQQSEEDAEEKPTSEPKVIIEKIIDMPEKIESGSEADFIVVLKNTNKKKYVQNMTVTVNCEEAGISLLADSNVFYFEKLGCQAILELPLKFKVEEKTVAGKYPVTLEISYDNPDAVSLTSVGKIELDVSQKLDVGLEVGDIAESVNAGDVMTIPIQVINMGRGSIYNVRCQIEMAGLTASTSLFLGNVDAGNAAGGELNVFAGMVFPEADTEEQRYGYTSGSVMLIYEDENGTEYQMEQEISTTVNPLVVNTSANDSEEESPKIGLQMVGGSVVLCGVAAAIFFFSLLIRKKKTGVEDE